MRLVRQVKITFLSGLSFCLRPSAKDQGITSVLVLVLVVLVLVLVLVDVVHHVVHFVIKRNLREKLLPSWDSNLGPSEH